VKTSMRTGLSRSRRMRMKRSTVSRGPLSTIRTRSHPAELCVSRYRNHPV
jgi:hypothetical protein